MQRTAISFMSMAGGFENKIQGIWQEKEFAGAFITVRGVFNEELKVKNIINTICFNGFF